jgi:hypothetical protein
LTIARRRHSRYLSFGAGPHQRAVSGGIGPT